MSWRTRLGLIFLTAALSACGSDNTVSPLPPALMTIVAGDGQTAIPGQALPIPLTVSLTTSAGDPVVGETVSWTIMSGTGTLSATSATTDAAGHSSANWTLGSETGTQSVQASIRWRVGPGDNGFTTFGLLFSATSAPPPPPPPTPQPVILHYDGTAWTTMLQGMSNADVSLTSIWGASSSAVFAVGSQCGGAMVLRYDGTAWTPPLAQSCPGSGFSNYASVSGSSASDVFVTFRSTLPLRLGGYVDHFNGQNWDAAVYVVPCGNNIDVLCAGPHGVWSSSSTDAFVVADSGIIAHYDGTSWQSLATGTRQALAGVWGDGPTGAVFAVGKGGIILRYDRTSWSVQPSGTTQSLNAVWGTSANDVFAVGAGGTILHYDGATWTSQNSGSTQALYGVWGVAGTAVFAVGDASTIIRYDGTSWTALTTSADIALRGVWGTSPTNVFAVGAPR